MIERRFVNHRTAGAPIEPRGVIADYRAGELTVWSATQIPHFLRLFLALQLGMTEDRVRVIAPDVGGGFGSKLQIYGEEILLAWVLAQARPAGQVDRDAVGEHGHCAPRPRPDRLRDDGRGPRRHLQGACTSRSSRTSARYMMLLTPLIPSLGAFVMTGCYRWDAVRTDITGVFTNKMGTDAIRGAGRPEATHYIEVMVDQMAARAGHRPARAAAQELHPEGGVPRPRRRSA